MSTVTELGKTGKYRGLFQRPGMEVRVKDVKKSYVLPGGARIEAVCGVSLNPDPYVATAIVGVSGCGKTTLLNLIGGVDVPDSGSIEVDDRDLSTLDERALEEYRLRDVGFIFQSYNLIPTLTALQNVIFSMTIARVPLKEARERAHSLLDIVDMLDKAETKPDALSGGEQQRVAIALAFANDPGLVMADEPTANLDKGNAQVVTELLVTLAAECGKTVIISTHDLRVADVVHRKVTMDGGTVVGVSGGE